MADKLYQCMKVVAKGKGIKASPEHDLYKLISPFILMPFTFPGGTWLPANGYDVPWSEVHWTDHGSPHHHTNPHQHVFQYNPDRGGWVRMVPAIFIP